MIVDLIAGGILLFLKEDFMGYQRIFMILGVVVLCFSVSCGYDKNCGDYKTKESCQSYSGCTWSDSTSICSGTSGGGGGGGGGY